MAVDGVLLIGPPLGAFGLAVGAVLGPDLSTKSLGPVVSEHATRKPRAALKSRVRADIGTSLAACGMRATIRCDRICGADVRVHDMLARARGGQFCSGGNQVMTSANPRRKWSSW